MDQGQLEWDPLIHTVDDTGVLPNDTYSYEYQYRQQAHGARQDTRSDHKTDSGFGSSNDDFQKGPPQRPSSPIMAPLLWREREDTRRSVGPGTEP